MLAPRGWHCAEFRRGGSKVAIGDLRRGLLDGQVALVTGGGTGLGRGTALELARCGASVLVVGRREEPLRLTVEQIAHAGGAAAWVIGRCAIARRTRERIVGWRSSTLGDWICS